MTDTVRLSPVVLGEEEEQMVLEVMRSGRLAQGPMVERLEEGFCQMTGAANAIAVSSGTTALVAALEVLDLAPGATVITSPFTFAATINAVLEAGASVAFVDIAEDFNMDASELEQAITSKVAAVMPVHLFGLAADMGLISKVAERHQLSIVEDAAQAHGASFDGTRVGAYGLGCFSLYATKNITAGEGGVITTNDDDHAHRLKVLRNQGMDSPYEYSVTGHNYRMTELQAAVALPQLRRLDELTAARRRNAAALRDGLNGIDGLILPTPDRGHVYHQYTVRVTGDAAMDRDAVRQGLVGLGVETGVYYRRPVFDHDPYRAHPRVQHASAPNAERAASEVLSLPVHPHLRADEVERVVAGVRDLLNA